MPYPDQNLQAETALRQTLADLEQNAPAGLDAFTEKIEAEVWQETACLRCANCCRAMSPSFSTQDIKRIATYCRLSVPAFKQKWLYKNKQGQWMNRSQPCQFLDRQTNKCAIYAVRPADCASFPHLSKKPMQAYLHVHKQNIHFCPATAKLVEKLRTVLESDACG